MPSGFGDTLFKAIIAIPAVHRLINRYVISKYADSGPLPGLYTTKERGITPLREMLHKEYFALEVPTPSPEEIETLPDIEAVTALFERKGPAPVSRVSVLLPLFAQHLTDAVFQSDGMYGTNASHEIILNQIYGNTPGDEDLLRSHEGGKLRVQTRQVNGGSASFPDPLLEEHEGGWRVRPHFAGLSYLNPKKVELLLERYKGREADVCATGLFQGNMTLGNFAITTLMVREHNRLCEGILAERERKGLSTSDDEIFRIAQQNNVTAYMKVVIEDYINAFAGQKLFFLDTQSFFYEDKRWSRETPLPYHFNILYRIHAMLPDALKGHEEKGFAAMLANNNMVMETGIGEIFRIASSQGAGQVRLGNTHTKLLKAEEAGISKARGVLGFFNAHRAAHNKDALGFDGFDPAFRDQLRELYQGKANRVEYAVGILAELPQPGLAEKLGLKDDPIIGPTLMGAIAKHAFRHILSNRFMTREFLNPEALGAFGWENLHATTSVADLVKRNLEGEMDAAAAAQLRVSFVNPT